MHRVLHATVDTVSFFSRNRKKETQFIFLFSCLFIEDRIGKKTREKGDRAVVDFAAGSDTMRLLARDSKWHDFSNDLGAQRHNTPVQRLDREGVGKRARIIS